MENLKQYPLWKQAISDASEQFKYGETIKFEWLYENLALTPPKTGTADQFKAFQFAFLAAVENFKKHMLIDHNMYLISSRAQGYTVVKPEDQTDEAWGVLRKKMRKAFRDVTSRLTYLDIGLISSSENINNMNKLNTLSALKTMNRRKLSEKLQSDKEDEVPEQRSGNGGFGKTTEAKTA